MKKIQLLFTLCVGATYLFAQQGSQPRQWDARSTEWYTPVPPKVQPGKTAGQPPSDAIILFDGKDLSKWVSTNRVEAGNKPDAAPWKIENGAMYVVPGNGGIRTKEYFGDCQLHIEFKSPAPENYNSQDRGNSGVFMPGGYEIQVLDGDNNTTYVNGMVGSIYKQQAPMVNAYSKNGEWQVYDIYWKAPVFDGEGGLVSPAIVTVVLNGIVVQNNYIVKGSTPYTGLPKYTPHGRMPISLQDHGTAVGFRNVWIRNL